MLFHTRDPTVFSVDVIITIKINIKHMTNITKEVVAIDPLADRKKPFLRWAKKKVPSLYENLITGRVRFKDEWLSEPKKEKGTIRSKEDAEDFPF